MASIAYITDAKLLDNHRLNQNRTMNFWRISTNTNFSKFGIGGLVFFLSKNKEHLSINKEKAFEYYLRSSEKGDYISQYNVAICYLNGVGVERNTVKAFYYANISASKNYELIMHYIDFLSAISAIFASLSLVSP